MEYAVQNAEGMGHFRRSGTYFGRMLAASLVAHIAFSVLLLSPRHGQFAARPIAYLDLSMTEPATASQATKQPDETSPKKSVPLPETPQRPAPTEFEKLQQGTREALESAAAKPEAIEQSSLALGITNGYFSSLAEGQTLHDDIRDYYFTILRTINEKWWVANGGQTGARARAMISVVIGRDGNVLKAEIVRASGSYSYDKSLLKAVEAASPFPPLPAQYRLSFFEAPLVFNPPLNLMATGSKS
jgi:protein TonB